MKSAMNVRFYYVWRRVNKREMPDKRHFIYKKVSYKVTQIKLYTSATPTRETYEKKRNKLSKFDDEICFLNKLTRLNMNGKLF